MSGFLTFVVMLLFSTVVTVVAKLPFGFQLSGISVIPLCVQMVT